jgi:nicotinamide-nucleotide amidase
MTAAALVAAARQKGLRLSTAESCTGGLVAAALTDVAGSSAVFDEGFVTYSNTAKQKTLGVPADVLTRHGAVSAETVAAMADGARRVSGAHVAVSISGIAGPGGGSPEKPVGTVWLGLAVQGHPTQVFHHRFSGDRAAVRAAAVATALTLLQEGVSVCAASS